MNWQITYKLEEIDATASKILERLHHPVVVFDAEMGSGKTTLIKALLRQMGSPDMVSSPTFSLVNEYFTTHKTVYHFDLYRLKNAEEALDMGFLHYVNQDALLLIEWPEKVREYLPEHYHVIRLRTIDANTRALSLSNS